MRTPERSTAARASDPFRGGSPLEPAAAYRQPRGSMFHFEPPLVMGLEQLLHAGLVLRDLLPRLGFRHREQDLATEPVACEVDHDLHPGPGPVADGLDRHRADRTD